MQTTRGMSSPADPCLRRPSRIPVQLDVWAGYGSAAWKATTVDLSPDGCILRGPPVPSRISVSLVIASTDVRERLRATGEVEWSRGDECGIAFAASCKAVAQEWCERLLAVNPWLCKEADLSALELPLGSGRARVLTRRHG